MPVKTDIALNPSHDTPLQDAPIHTSHESTVDSLREDAVRATAGFEKAKAKVSETIDEAQKIATGSVGFGQETMAAYAQSFLIWSAGMQDVSRQQAAMMTSSIEAALGHVRASHSVKTVAGALEWQTTVVRGSAEKAVADTSRLATAYIRLAGATLAPLNARIGQAAEKITWAA